MSSVRIPHELSSSKKNRLMPPQSLLLARAAKVRATSVSHAHLGLQIHYVFKTKFHELNEPESVQIKLMQVE